MENRPLIGIMVAARRNRPSILRLYRRYCQPNARLFAFCPGDIMWSKRRIIGLIPSKRKWKQQMLPFPHAIYNRCFNKNTITIQRLEAAIGRDKCFNAINFFNKWSMYNLLKPSPAGSYVPDTFLYNRAELPALTEKYSLLFIKPLYGAMGKSVYRVERMDNGEIHIALHSLAANYICADAAEMQLLLDKHLGEPQYLVQQGVRIHLLEGKHFDLRVLVQKNRTGAWAVSNIASRLAHRRYYNTAICEAVCEAADILPQIFGQGELEATLQALRETSIVAAQEAELHLGLLGELSVDFVVDEQKKLWIIEMNGKPNKNIYADLKGSDFRERIYRRPMEYACYLSGLSRPSTSPQSHEQSPSLLHAGE